MLRTPTHFVELGSNSKSNPLIQIQTIHHLNPKTTSSVAVNKLQQQQRPNCDLLYHEFVTEHNNNNKYQFPKSKLKTVKSTKITTNCIAGAANPSTLSTTVVKEQQQQQQQTGFIKFHKGLLSTSPFSFKKSSKKLATKENNSFIEETNNNNNSSGGGVGVGNNQFKFTTSSSNKFNTKNKKTKTKKSYFSNSASSDSLSSLSAESTFSLPLSNISSCSSSSKSNKSFTTANNTKTAVSNTTIPPVLGLVSQTSTTTSSSVFSRVMSPTSQTPTRTSLFDSCHRKIRLIGGVPVAFLGGLVA